MDAGSLEYPAASLPAPANRSFGWRLVGAGKAAARSYRYYATQSRVDVQLSRLLPGQVTHSRYIVQWQRNDSKCSQAPHVPRLNRSRRHRHRLQRFLPTATAISPGPEEGMETVAVADVIWAAGLEVAAGQGSCCWIWE